MIIIICIQKDFSAICKKKQVPAAGILNITYLGPTRGAYYQTHNEQEQDAGIKPMAHPWNGRWNPKWPKKLEFPTTDAKDFDEQFKRYYALMSDYQYGNPQFREIIELGNLGGSKFPLSISKYMWTNYVFDVAHFKSCGFFTINKTDDINVCNIHLYSHQVIVLLYCI